MNNSGTLRFPNWIWHFCTGTEPIELDAQGSSDVYRFVLLNYCSGSPIQPDSAMKLIRLNELAGALCCPAPDSLAAGGNQRLFYYASGNRLVTQGNIASLLSIRTASMYAKLQNCGSAIEGLAVLLSEYVSGLLAAISGCILPSGSRAGGGPASGLASDPGSSPGSSARGLGSDAFACLVESAATIRQFHDAAALLPDAELARSKGCRRMSYRLNRLNQQLSSLRETAPAADPVQPAPADSADSAGSAVPAVPPGPADAPAKGRKSRRQAVQTNSVAVILWLPLLAGLAMSLHFSGSSPLASSGAAWVMLLPLCLLFLAADAWLRQAEQQPYSPIRGEQQEGKDAVK